jgi:hypothetical protein
LRWAVGLVSDGVRWPSPFSKNHVGIICNCGLSITEQ